MTTTPTTDNATTTTTAQPVQQPEAQPQPAAAQNAETKQKLASYLGIQMCRGCNDSHGLVLFTDGSSVALENFDDIGYACRMMDEESATRFLANVAMNQSEGRLQALLPIEEQLKLGRSQAREAFLKNLQTKEGELNEKYHQLTKVAKLSTRALAKPVMNSLEETLLKPELEKYFQEMSERGWTIRIRLEMPKSPCDDPDMEDDGVELFIRPEDLVSKDISEELADAEDERKEFLKEAAKLGF